MKTIFSDQYHCPCVIYEDGDTSREIIEACFSAGAFAGTGSTWREELVVQLRHDIGPEVWSETALIRSIPINKNTD